MKIYDYFRVIFAGLIIYGCNGYLDTNPSNGLGMKEAIQNEADLETALRGIYSELVNASYYGADFVIYGDVTGDDVQTVARGAQTTSAYTFAWREVNSPLSFWMIPGTAIGCANFILEELGKGALPDSKFVRDAKGQALALRALCHFDLLLTYGYPYLKDQGRSLGTPLIKKMLAADDFLPRSTVAEGYDMIIKDLQDALLFTNDGIKNGFINLWSVKSLLARVYLYKGDWENAFNYASDVIANSPYGLVPNENYMESWGQQYTTESIFDLSVSASSSSNGGLLGYLAGMQGAASVIATKDFVDLLNEDTDDVRLELLRKNTRTDMYYIRKYPGRGGFLAVNDIKVLRLSEIYLIAAEAALKKTVPDQDKADYYLNEIRRRANPAAGIITATEDMILKERRKELVLEGHRFFDMMRLGKTIERNGGFHFLTEDELISPNWNDYRIILPIPQAEMDVNPKMKGQQNPGY